MAKGKYCPMCGNLMYAIDEIEQPKGSYVYYECRNSQCRFTEKVFEER